MYSICLIFFKFLYHVNVCQFFFSILGKRRRITYFNHLYVKIDFSIGIFGIFHELRNYRVLLLRIDCVLVRFTLNFLFSKHKIMLRNEYREGPALMLHKITHFTRFSWMHNQVFYNFFSSQIGANALAKEKKSLQKNCFKFQINCNKIF